MRALTVCEKEKRTHTLGMVGDTPERSALIERVFQRLHLVAGFCLTAMAGVATGWRREAGR